MKDFSSQAVIFDLMQRGFTSWPLYTMILAFGQLLGFSAFQLALLDSREQNQGYNSLITGSVFIIGSLFWWKVYRHFASVVVLTIPFIVYALAFGLFLVSNLPVMSYSFKWIADRIALWMYTFASSSGAFYFVLNFG